MRDDDPQFLQIDCIAEAALAWLILAAVFVALLLPLWRNGARNFCREVEQVRAAMAAPPTADAPRCVIR